MSKQKPQKTEKGLEEIRNKTYGLSPKLRTVLILIDGIKSTSTLIEQVAKLGVSAQMMADLEKEGFITGLERLNEDRLSDSLFDEDERKNSLVAKRMTTEPSEKRKERSVRQRFKPNPQSDEVLEAARSFIKDYLLKVLGDDAATFLTEVEQAKTRDELIEQADKCRTLIRSFEGSEKADTLWRMVQGLLK